MELQNNGTIKPESINKIIDAKDKNVRELLKEVKYSVDVYQREYTWERKHVEQLIIDLSNKFQTNYQESHEREDVANISLNNLYRI